MAAVIAVHDAGSSHRLGISGSHKASYLELDLREAYTTARDHPFRDLLESCAWANNLTLRRICW